MSWAAGRQAFSVAADGRVVASVDGSEVLAWSGEELLPLWKDLGDAVFVAVAVDARGVWLLDEEGMLQQRRLEDGALVNGHKVLDGPGVALAAGDGHLIVAGKEVVLYLRGVDLCARIPLAGVVAVAVSHDGRRAALAESAGAVTVLDLTVPKVIGRIEVGGRPSAVCWSREGYWLVAVGHRLRPLRADGQQVAPPRGCTEAPVDELVLAVHGVISAVRCGPHRIDLLATEGGTRCGSIKVGREIVGIAGGPHGALWVGLRHGDVQRFDLLSGVVSLSHSHPGRARVPWPVDTELDPAQVRGLLARHLAGGQPLSEYVPPPEADQPGCAPMTIVAVIVSVLLLGGLLAWYVYG
jgi:hypothetical protein